MKHFVQQGHKSEGVFYFIFCLNIFSDSVLGTNSKATTWKEQGLQNRFNLLVSN